jgi:hypothetical protein
VYRIYRSNVQNYGWLKCGHAQYNDWQGIFRNKQIMHGKLIGTIMCRLTGDMVFTLMYDIACG